VIDETTRVLVVGTFDSFLRVGALAASHLAARGATVKHVIAYARDDQIRETQLESIGLQKVPETHKLERIASRSFLQDYDVVILALDGGRTRKFMVRFASGFGTNRSTRPITVSLYPGLLFRFHLEGMMSRINCDLFLLNSKQDFDLYAQTLGELGIEGNNALHVGLFTLPPRRQPAARQVAPDAPVVFVGQPTVPGGKHERAALVEALVALAERNPQVPVVIKPRHRPEETTLHRERFHYGALLDEVAQTRSIPPNLALTYEPLGALFERMRLCLTFSSTAALEGVFAGVPTRVLTDLGVHENLGNHFFLGSGLLANLETIEPDMPFAIDEAWLANNATAGADHVDAFVARLGALVRAQRDAEAALPLFGGPLFGRTEAFEERIVARHGRQGLALFGAQPKPSWRVRLKRLLR
jgi:hypothetical protein